MSYTDRYRRLCEQRAYRRRIRARGLAALLEPYTVRPPFPAQRRSEREGVTVKIPAQPLAGTRGRV